MRQKLNIEILIMIIVSLLLLGYSISFALSTTMSTDEAYSYLYYGKTLDGFSNLSLANNHPLNSFLIYLSSYFFPYNDFMIRLPNIIFLILYFFFTIKISNNTRIKLLTFGMLTLYWYLIPDYFTQARGYGIASSIVLIFLYQFLNKPFTNKTILISIAVLLVGSYAFLGLVSLIVSVSIYYLIFVIARPIGFIKKNLLAVLSLFSGLIYITHMLISVSVEGKPLYGSFNNSFLSSTMGFYKSSFFEGDYNFGSVATNMLNASSAFSSLDILSAFALFIFICFIGIMLYKKKELKVKVSLITVFCFALLYFSSIFLDKPFITGRSLLPFFPLIAFSMVEIIETGISFIRSPELRVDYSKMISLILFIGLLFNYHNKVENTPFNLSKKAKEEKIKRILNGKPSAQQLYYQKKAIFVQKKID